MKVSFQPIPALAPDKVWGWCVSDGQIIVGRFGSKEYAEKFAEALQGGGSSALTQFTDDDQRDLLALMRFVRYDKHSLLKALTFLRENALPHPSESIE